MKVPRLIAHRGFAKQYPENTLIALLEALKAGACFIEFDVQFTADGIPVLLHDGDLNRLADRPESIGELPWAEVRYMTVGESKAMRRTYPEAFVPALSEAVYLLRNWPHCRAFVEIKQESLDKFGIEFVIKRLAKILRPAVNQCTLIGYNCLAIRCARAMGISSIGWIIDQWSDTVRPAVTELAPEFVFCNYKKVPKTPDALFKGPWQWALYEITDPQLALDYCAMGADLIETMDIGAMLQDPLLRKAACFARPTL